jgi:hypothetical protein
MDTNPHLDPYFEELRDVQQTIKRMFDLSAYEAAAIALQYIHTRTIEESLGSIAAGISGIIEECCIVTSNSKSNE